MLEVMSNNHELLFYLGLAFGVFGSILAIAGKSKLTIGDDHKNSKSTNMVRFLFFVIFIGGLITYYSSILVDYKNYILLMMFLTMLVFFRPGNSTGLFKEI